MQPWLDRWFATAERGGVVVLAVIFAVTAWGMLFATYWTTDLHHDLTELYTWSLNVDWGNDKHPPLGSGITSAWFTVFPADDWAFKLLAALNAALGLYSVDLVARQFVRGEKRLLILLFLLLTPVYWFHGLRLGSTTLLLWTWPLATACFLRAFHTRAWHWAAAAGLAAAIAVLAKYFSLVLIAGFAMAAISHPQRKAYFFSASPWISAIVGIAALSPHMFWLYSTGAAPLAYPQLSHGAAWPSVLKSILWLWPAGLAYASPMLVTYVLLVRPAPAALKAALWPRDPARRMLAVILVCVLVLPIVSALITKIMLVSLWLLASFFLIPILVLSDPDLSVSRIGARRLATGIAIFALVALAGSGAHAWYRHLKGDRDYRQHYQLMAQAAGEAWDSLTERPLIAVGGERKLAMGVSFYHPDHPKLATRLREYALTQNYSPELGGVLICPTRDIRCVETGQAQIANHPSARRQDVELAAVFLGKRGKPESYALFLLPPVPLR